MSASILLSGELYDLVHIDSVTIMFGYALRIFLVNPAKRDFRLTDAHFDALSAPFLGFILLSIGTCVILTFFINYDLLLNHTKYLFI